MGLREIGEALPKPLSAMRSNRFEMGRTAIRKILESVDRRPGPCVVDTGFEIVPAPRPSVLDYSIDSATISR